MPNSKSNLDDLDLNALVQRLRTAVKTVQDLMEPPEKPEKPTEKPTAGLTDEQIKGIRDEIQGVRDENEALKGLISMTATLVNQNCKRLDALESEIRSIRLAVNELNNRFGSSRRPIADNPQA